MYYISAFDTAMRYYWLHSPGWLDSVWINGDHAFKVGEVLCRRYFWLHLLPVAWSPFLSNIVTSYISILLLLN